MARKSVGIGQVVVTTDPEDILEMIGLGSCAGIFISLPGRIAAAAHSLLAVTPEGERSSSPGKYVDTAVPYLVKKLADAGVPKGRCRVWVVGGAQIFSFGNQSASATIGSRNTDLAVQLLRNSGFRPDSSLVGGSQARRASLLVGTGEFESSVAAGKPKDQRT